MTSTTSSLNGAAQFRQTYLWALRKNIGVMALLALLLFLVNPLILLISMSNETKSLSQQVGISQAEKMKILAGNYTDLVNEVLPTFAVMLVLLFCAVLCVILFGYIQNKRSVDLYHALPVSREQMLLGRWCAGLTILFVPVLLDFLSLQIIGAAYGVTVTDGARAPMATMLWVMLMGTAVFTFALFMMMCAGTTLDAILSALGINAGYPLLILCVYWIAQMLVPGMSIRMAEHMQLITALAPIAAAFVSLYEPFSMGFLIWWIAMTVLLLAGSVWLYRKRKSETAEDNFAFPIPKIIIRFLVSAVGGIWFGLMLSEASDTAFFIGVLFGSLATHIILETIYSRGFKNLKKSFLWYGAFVVAFVAFYGVLCTGMFGYDTRVPDVSEVESVTINKDTFWNGSGTQLVYGNNDTTHHTILKLAPTIQEPDNIKTVIEVQKDIIQQYRKQFPYRFKNNTGIGLSLTYKLKDGSVFTRSYQSYSDDINLYDVITPAYEKLSAIPEFTITSDLIFYLSPQDIKSIDVYTIQNVDAGDDKMVEKTFVPDEQTAERLKKALEKDFRGKKVDRMSGTYYRYDSESEESDVVNLRITYKDSITPKSEELKALLNGYEGEIYVPDGMYYVSGDSETAQLLKELGWFSE
ncbi:MAG: ABC transporter permease [Oscillospiraceae bacterium]|jgi:ABC-2 type transport system permease protein